MAALCSMATYYIARHEMNEAYRKNPLTLERSVGHDDWQVPTKPIRVPTDVSLHFKGKMNECHETRPRMTDSPALGRFSNGTYHLPQTIAEKEQQITIQIESRRGERREATIIVVRDPPADTERKQLVGTDAQGHSARFDLMVVAKNDSWVLKRDDVVVPHAQSARADATATPAETPVCGPILKLVRELPLDAYAEIIAVGTASREGKAWLEEERAGARSRAIAQWVNAGLDEIRRPKNVYAMNLGQFVPAGGDPTPRTTAPERRVVVIGVVRDRAVNLGEALTDAFDRNRKDAFIDFLAQHYPRRTLKRDIELYTKRPRPTVPCPPD